MATSKEYKEYILEKLSILEAILCRSMMGEYLLYYENTLFGGIYDNRLLIKKTEGNKKFNLKEVLPYEGAKRNMYLVEELEDTKYLKQVVLETYKELKK